MTTMTMTQPLQASSSSFSTGGADASSSSSSSSSFLTKKKKLHHSMSDLSTTTQTTAVIGSTGSNSSSSDNYSDDDSCILNRQTLQLMEQHKQYCSSCSSSLIDNDDTTSRQRLPSCMRNTSSSISRRRSNHNSNVSFSTIHIRDFERIAGDHPETSIGVPLSLGWAYQERHAISIQKWEKQKMDAFLEDDSAIVLKPRKGSTGGCGGASGNVKRLGAMTRKRLLMDEFNIPLDEIVHAERALHQFKQQLERQRRKQQEEEDGCGGHNETSSRPKRNKLLRSFRKGVLNKLALRTPRHCRQQ